MHQTSASILQPEMFQAWIPKSIAHIPVPRDAIRKDTQMKGAELGAHLFRYLKRFEGLVRLAQGINYHGGYA